MKQLLRHYGKLGLLGALRFSRGNFHQYNSLCQQAQLPLKMRYRELSRDPDAILPSLDEVGFRAYSQFEEDGHLLYLLSLMGFKQKNVVEICAGDGMECMAANLIINHGFQGYLFDGDKHNVARGVRFFDTCRDTLLNPPVYRQAWITVENVNQLLREAGVSGEVDLLSIDVDGNDYWIWDAIDVISPRLCVLETQNLIPSHLSLTIPYDPNFFCWKKPFPDKYFFGMSLGAAVSLARKKGYRLVGAHSHGFNAYFLRNDILADRLPEITIEAAHDNAHTRVSRSKLWPLLEHHDWRSVGD